MRVLVVGAGASYAEAEHASLPEERRPPLIKNFATKMWSNYNPHFLLSGFLKEQGHESGNDASACFVALEKAETPNINVERFFEYAYTRREWMIPGHTLSEYENLLYHGIVGPLFFLLVTGLFENGVEPSLTLSKTVAGHLRPGDVVLNLNYDTIFEVGAEQAGHDLTFLPNKPRKPSLLVSKPHGSMNLLVNESQQSFYFARPLFGASVQPGDGSNNYVGIVPPRLNKQYAQHWVAKAIIEATDCIKPKHIIFWGVGLTDSDKDLLELYRRWCNSATQIDFINPSVADVTKAKKLLSVEAHQYPDVATWHSALMHRATN